ncbi:hypothetical protein GY31_12660 [Lysinibacillus sphaericus]|uniref:hypothetical protein n=1 Tax=Lysinibacillus TaxID=400634 RepID=UPI00084B6CD9|nr:hypothetical protein [Lysinibacillus sphaericus]OEC01168.1 hypothetical protein GY31_12660 [Lysinibacillus sphaericus]
MRKNLFMISLILFVISALPLFQMVRERVTTWKLDNRYTIEQAYAQGFLTHNDVSEIVVNGHLIEIVEEKTGEKGTLTYWDENEGVKPGDIVKLHLSIDNKEVTTTDEIWLSNRDRGGRYYSWLDILTVNDDIAIVQRLTDDNGAMEDRRWKIIWIDEKGKLTEDQISYYDRSENPLAVRLINISSTSLMGMGYYSDILFTYPTIFFPLMFPWGTGLFSVLFFIIAFLQRKKSPKLN